MFGKYNIENFTVSHSAAVDLESGTRNMIHTAQLSYNENGEDHVIAKAEIIDHDKSAATVALIMELGMKVMQMEEELSYRRLMAP